MVCSLVKAAISVQDSKHLHVHCNSSIHHVQSEHHQSKAAPKHEFDSDSCRRAGDTRAVIINTEQLVPTSLRLIAASSCKPLSFICKRSSSGKKLSLWDEAGLPSKHLQTCLLLLFALLLCFSFILAICTIDASTRINIAGKRIPPEERRLMGFQYSDNTEEFNSLEKRIDHIGHSSPSHFHVGVTAPVEASITYNKEAALHGLGAVFSKGTKSMQNLIIANLEESCDMLDFRLFLRTLYRSGAMAKADLVLLFPWPSLPQDVSDVIQEEDNSFKKLLEFSAHMRNSDSLNASDVSAFKGFPAFKEYDVKGTDKRRLIMWGESSSSSSNHEESHVMNLEYGSVVGFQMNELDSTDGFSEFLINPSSQLRRWLCYQMLLGLLRLKFKLVMLVDLGGVVILDDVFSQGKKKEFLYLSLEDCSWADAPFECDQPARQGAERQSILPRGIPDNDQMVLTNSIQSAPLHRGAGRITPMERLDDKDLVIHETNTLNKKGISIGGGPKRRIKIHVDNSKGLQLAKRRKQQMMDRHAHYHGTRDHDEVTADLHEEKRIMITGHAAMGEARNYDMAKPNAGAGEQGHAKTKQIMMEMVYGKEVWECLEQAEKQRKVVSSRVILGSMRSAKGLANSMAVEIVRVALQRNSKLSFPDRALLSYLVLKSSHLLGKRVTDSLQLMSNGESMVHSVDNSAQRNVFVRPHDGQKYTVVQAISLNVRPKSMQPHRRDQSFMSNLTLSHLIRADICATTVDSEALYNDCGPQ